MRKLMALLMLAGCAGLCACSRNFNTARTLSAATPELSVQPQLLSATTEPAERDVRSGVQIVDLRGDPAAIGTEHGRQCGTVIHLLYDKYLSVTLQGKKRAMALLAASIFEGNMLPRHRDEMIALSQEVKLNPADVALAQCFLDLMPSTGCSTITLPASASPDGVARFGRNLDFPSLDIADKHSVVFVYHPAGQYQFVAIGWPGMIGVLSGMNEHGLCLANMEVPRDGHAPVAMPYTLLYRTVLEQCRTVDEAIKLLQDTPRQTANNLMLMDAAGNRAVVEIRPEGVTVRAGEKSTALISTNHQRGQDTATPGYCWRYDALREASAAQYGKIDAHSIEWMLEKVVQGHTHGDMTLQSMVFEPANRVVYLATGADAPSHPYQRIDFKPYFRPVPAK